MVAKVEREPDRRVSSYDIFKMSMGDRYEVVETDDEGVPTVLEDAETGDLIGVDRDKEPSVDNPRS